MYRLICVSVALCAVFACAASANATILYQESFDEGTGTVLNGLNGMVATSGMVTNASGQAAISGLQSAAVPFTPQDGQIYSLSADMRSTNGSWVVLGFMADTLATSGNFFDPSANLWQSTDTGGYSLGAIGPGWEGGLQYQAMAPEPSAAVHTFRMDLDTTNSAQWTAQYFIDGQSQAGPVNLPAGMSTTFRYIGFGADQADSAGYVDNFTLTTTATPEPSTIVLLGVGMFSLLAYAWRKRK